MTVALPLSAGSMTISEFFRRCWSALLSSLEIFEEGGLAESRHFEVSKRKRSAVFLGRDRKEVSTELIISSVGILLGATEKFRPLLIYWFRSGREGRMTN